MASDAPSRAAKIQTPVMRQYLSAKESYPDALLFFRMGDFYELFFDDALTAAKLLDLKLTSRDRNDPDPTPMCGVPHHAAQVYIARLLEMGHNVALCEQVEEASKAKGIVKRSVVRVFTPALVLDGDALAPRANQFLAAVIPPDGTSPDARWGLAAFDLTTGELFVGEVPDVASLAADLARLDARELVVPPEAESSARAVAKMFPRLYVRVQPAPTPHEAVELLAAALGEDALRSAAQDVPVGARTAAGAALAYARASQPGHPVAVQRLIKLDARDHVALDEAAQHHLELFQTTRGEKKGSLLHHIDATVTPMGARRLRSWIAFPLTDARRIRRRHDAVEALLRAPDARAALRSELDSIADLERIAVRATLGAATPRDLAQLRDGLARLPAIAQQVGALGTALRSVSLPVETCAPVATLLNRALGPQPPLAPGEGGVFSPGFDARIDELTGLSSGGRGEVAAIELRERERTKIASLKVGYNRIFGYYVEVTKPNLKLVPEDYKRKQTVAGGERFITEELQELETRILSAEEELRTLEIARFAELVTEIARSAGVLVRIAGALADLDALGALAETAHRYDYVRPEIDEGTAIELGECRHPVVESVLEPGAFVPNDVAVDARGERLLLITGPNMAGKSTLMRQVALTVILAQAGAFVPARTARIGVVDKVFTRVGASDDLSRGQSTFMVEMRETAAILRGATSRSLVLFDEIGRGTSTFDGLSIAWSVAEYLHDVVRCRALFATHYHELCALSESRKHVANVNVSARETGEDIVFLHKLSRGGASRSYGIAVARLAGLPEPVIARSRALLKDLERGDGPGAPSRQAGLFEPKPEPRAHPVLAALDAADLDRMTPLDALNFLSQLRALSPPKR